MRVEQVMMTPDIAQRILDAGMCCAWHDCEASFKGDMPPDWCSLLTYSTPQPVLDFREIPPGATKRDGALCPDHVRALEENLKDLGGELLAAVPEGEA